MGRDYGETAEMLLRKAREREEDLPGTSSPMELIQTALVYATLEVADAIRDENTKVRPHG